MYAFRAIAAAVALLLLPSLARAEDWTTTDGKVYKDVKVLKLEADAVTILDSDGGALVPLATLSPDLQERFNYDPLKAKAAAAARAKDESSNGPLMEAERVEAAKLKAAQDAKDKADKKAVDDAKAAAAAAGSKDGPLHASPFDRNPGDETSAHDKVHDAPSTNSAENPVAPH